MPAEILLVRHGETEANAAGVWQGQSNSALSAAGVRQIRQLGERLDPDDFDVVVTSDLSRAVETTAGLAASFETDPTWRELDLGEWEGLTRDQVVERFPSQLEALQAGEDIPFGGGERVSELVARVNEAFERLVERVGEGGRALVVTHGGAIFALLGDILETDLRFRAVRLTNTAMTRIVVGGWGPQVAVFNDATHLPGDPVRAEPGSAHVWMIRHGETDANVEGRWQGRANGQLTSEGQRQATRLAARLPDLDAIYTSPLDRARHTASTVASPPAGDPEVLSDLAELAFGRWEDLTRDEIVAADAAGLAAVVEDPTRRHGGNGETYEDLQRRMRAVVDNVAGRHPGGAVGVVTHGAAANALITNLLDIDHARRFRMGWLDNTGIARIVYEPSGPTLAAWNLTPHLED